MREQHIKYIIGSIEQRSSFSVDDLVELAKMNDFDLQHKYLQLKYGEQNN